ncbi:hypothetical protein [Coleofasciculus sp.]|uniref:hypothetical protein n=1 Tax=Coleofasciculus sp. TaxID=3100458 RepID=UPI003A33739D
MVYGATLVVETLHATSLLRSRPQQDLLEMNAIAGLFSPYIYGIATDSDQG